MTSNNSWKQAGLGDSGEVYMVGRDYKLRNNSRFLVEDSKGFMDVLAEVGVSKEISDKMLAQNTSIGLLEVRTGATEKAIQGTKGFDIVPDYRGVPVLSAYSPIDIMGTKWVIMAEIDKAEAFEVQDSLVNMSIIVSLVLFGLLIAFAMYIAGWFSKPIMILCDRAKDIVGGKLSQ